MYSPVFGGVLGGPYMQLLSFETHFGAGRLFAFLTTHPLTPPQKLWYP